MTDKELAMFEELKDPENLVKDNGAFFDRYKEEIPLWWGKIRDTLEPIGYYEAFERGWLLKQERKQGRAIYDSKTGSFKMPDTPPGSDINPVETFEEKEVDWLIWGYMPKGQITIIAGEGGTGKTTIECNIAAAISTGEPSFLTPASEIPDEFIQEKSDGGIVLLFSSEESITYTLRRRLRKAKANLNNVFAIDPADDRFPEVKFNSTFLETVLERYKPSLCIFDPIQAFVPPDIHMGDRNAMRACLAPLIGYGEKYGTSFLIVVHANKQSGVWGRKRIADSADIWDIARSVLMVGETQTKGVRYISQEKSNYGPLSETVLFRIKDEVVTFESYSDKHDKDFICESDYTTRQKPARDDAKELILDYLKDGEKEVSELDEMAAAMGVSKNTLARAKTDLKQEGAIKTWSRGYGKEKKWFASLTAPK